MKLKDIYHTGDVLYAIYPTHNSDDMVSETVNNVRVFKVGTKYVLVETSAQRLYRAETIYGQSGINILLDGYGTIYCQSMNDYADYQEYLKLSKWLRSAVNWQSYSLEQLRNVKQILLPQSEKGE